MIQNELEEKFFHGQTRQEVIDRIIEFELDNDIMPDLGEVLEYGFSGYHYVDDEVLKEMYLEYFLDEEPEEEYYPTDEQGYDGHGNPIGDSQ